MKTLVKLYDQKVKGRIRIGYVDGQFFHGRIIICTEDHKGYTKVIPSGHARSKFVLDYIYRRYKLEKVDNPEQIIEEYFVELL